MPVPSQPSPQVSALEMDLDGRGLQVAATHYRQAIANFVGGNFEAANGQLRSFLEALFRGMGVSNGAQVNVGADAAVLHLRTVGHLDDAECQFLRGLWAGSQDNGPHAGLSNEEEARFRLHAFDCGCALHSPQRELTASLTMCCRSSSFSVSRRRRFASRVGRKKQAGTIQFYNLGGS